jgi:transglutaminase-like putative cysteine protease
LFHRARKDNNMGIHFAKQNRITSSNPLKVTYSLRIFQLLLILFGVFGPIYGFISGLQIDVSNRIVITTIVLSTIYFFILFQFPSLLKYTLTASMILYFIAVFEFLNEIKNGFWHIENYCIYYLNNYYNMNIYPYIASKNDKVLVVSIFIVFVIVIFTGIASSVILFNYLSYVYTLLSAALIILPFTVGIIPGTLPLALYLICIICIIGMSRFTTRYNGSSIKKNQKKQWKLNIVLGNKFRYIIGLKIGIILSTILALLFLIIPFMFPTKSYEELNIRDTKIKLQDKLMNFSIEDTTKKLNTNNFSNWTLFSTTKSYGGLSGGELGKEGEVTFDNKTVLKVKMPIISNTVYLKGYVGSVYTGDKWEKLSEEDELSYNKLVKSWKDSNFNVGNQSSYFLSLINKLNKNIYEDFKFSQSTMTVTNVRSNRKYSYAPYNTIFNDKTMDILDPLYVSPYSNNDTEDFVYYTNYADIFNFIEGDEFAKCLSYYKAYTRKTKVEENNTLNQLIEYRDNELKYRNFVYSTYTKISDKVPASLVRDFGNYKYNKYGNNVEGGTLKDYLEKVANYLEENTSYSLKPGPLPEGKDYIEYFLYDNKVGYCAHYASAATVMLRIMGIPARYVEGYIVKESNIHAGEIFGSDNVQIRGEEEDTNVPIKEVNIPDANAHAWVEVYVDGFGWVPVEFTSGYNSTNNGVLDPAVVNQLQPTNIPNTPSNINPTATLAPTKTPDANEAVENKTDDMDSTTNKGNNIGESSNSGEDLEYSNSANKKLNFIYLMKVLIIILRVIIIIVLFIVIVGIRWIYITNNNRKLKNNNKDKVVLLRYKELLRMLSYYGVEIDNELPYQLAAKEVEEKCSLLNKGELEKFMTICLKAKFSQDKISNEEADTIELYYKECIDSLYNNRSFVEKIYIKYFKIFS